MTKKFGDKWYVVPVLEDDMDEEFDMDEEDEEDMDEEDELDMKDERTVEKP